ncbi:DUF397 domain-containing protein [Actinoallomurus sp. NPDC050550]|uniref:DUF397 domain-containing protein n=1 Tax=Actinoallomurus sp. NPDC050550 TaxID=3154937 RepID=UPI0033F7A6C3
MSPVPGDRADRGPRLVTSAVLIDWRRSVRSGQEGGECVESALLWRKSIRSGHDGGQCVEVAVIG